MPYFFGIHVSNGCGYSTRKDFHNLTHNLRLTKFRNYLRNIHIGIYDFRYVTKE